MISLRYIAVLFAAISPFASGETIVCSYPAFRQPGDSSAKDTVVVELKIEGRTAHVRWAGRFDFADDYEVLANTKHGLVISRSYAAPEVEGMSPTIGAYTFLIERPSGNMRYQGFFVGERDLTSARGTCLFQK